MCVTFQIATRCVRDNKEGNAHSTVHTRIRKGQNWAAGHSPSWSEAHGGGGGNGGC